MSICNPFCLFLGGGGGSHRQAAVHEHLLSPPAGDLLRAETAARVGRTALLAQHGSVRARRAARRGAQQAGGGATSAAPGRRRPLLAILGAAGDQGDEQADAEQPDPSHRSTVFQFTQQVYTRKYFFCRLNVCFKFVLQFARCFLTNCTNRLK